MNTVSLVLRRVLRSYRLPCAFPDEPVRLAEERHSLGRFSKRTTRHRLARRPTGDSRLGRLDGRLVCPVALSPADFRPYCTALFGVLCSVRSRYLFAIGLEECLAFPVDAWGVHREYPIPAILELTLPVLPQLTGLSPCIALRSRRLQMRHPGLSVSPKDHIAREGFGLGCVAVTRGY